MFEANEALGFEANEALGFEANEALGFEGHAAHGEQDVATRKTPAVGTLEPWALTSALAQPPEPAGDGPRGDNLPFLRYASGAKSDTLRPSGSKRGRDSPSPVASPRLASPDAFVVSNSPDLAERCSPERRTESC